VLARLKEVVSEHTLYLPTAGRIAASVSAMQDTLRPWLQVAIVDAGSLFVTSKSSQGVEARDVANYLEAVAQLQLPVPKDVVKV
jgi:hypothetical protein